MRQRTKESRGLVESWREFVKAQHIADSGCLQPTTRELALFPIRRKMAQVTSFRGRALPRHNAQSPQVVRERYCVLKTRGTDAQIYDAQAAKSDIDWF
jgi:hypothetical protein